MVSVHPSAASRYHWYYQHCYITGWQEGSCRRDLDICDARVGWHPSGSRIRNMCAEWKCSEFYDRVCLHLHLRLQRSGLLIIFVHVKSRCPRDDHSVVDHSDRDSSRRARRRLDSTRLDSTRLDSTRLDVFSNRRHRSVARSVTSSKPLEIERRETLFLKRVSRFGSVDLDVERLTETASRKKSKARHCARSVSPEFSIWYDNAADERIDA